MPSNNSHYLIEKLKNNIQNLDIFIEKQTTTFKQQQDIFRENEQQLKKI